MDIRLVGGVRRDNFFHAGFRLTVQRNKATEKSVALVVSFYLRSKQHANVDQAGGSLWTTYW